MSSLLVWFPKKERKRKGSKEGTERKVIHWLCLELTVALLLLFLWLSIEPIGLLAVTHLCS